MDPRSIQFIAEACDGRVMAGDPRTMVSRITTDSRKVGPGDLFVALAGEKFDGHTFLAATAERGATAVLIEHRRLEDTKSLPASVAVVAVISTRLALGKLAGRYRADFEVPIVAVGGSNGKTTTKELLASVLGQSLRTLWSEASFNNDIGVPLTLMRLDSSHQAAVLEVGTNHPGELAPLLDVIRPRFGVITSIGREHLEYFGDLNGVVREEGTIGEHLPLNGRMFINGDTLGTGELAARARCPVVRVGLSSQNDWRARHVRVGENGVEFQVDAPEGKGSGEYRVRLLGQHQVTNALLALAVGTELGVAPEHLRRGLAECAPPKMRMQLSTVNGVRILDDSYNANADSVIAALQTLATLPLEGRSGRRIAVLGEMAELGTHAAAAHEEVGRKSAELGVDCLVSIGRWSGLMAAAASAGGISQVVQYPDVATAAASGGLASFVEPGDAVLLKASRSAGLEKVVDALRRDAAGTSTRS